MGMDEAKANAALAYIDLLDKKLDAILDNSKSEREESGRRFEVHSQAIINRATETIEKKVGELGDAIREMVNDKIKACLADQDRDISAVIVDVGNLKQDVAELDVRTREVPLLRGRVEHLESIPGQKAIGTVGKLVLASGAVIMAFIGALFTWLFTRGAPQ